jgi:hypothetical protein
MVTTWVNSQWPMDTWPLPCSYLRKQRMKAVARTNDEAG